MARSSDGETALHKHLRVLDAFQATHPDLSLTEIATHTGLAMSTTHRLASELESEGLLERLPDRRYRLGVRLWEFASRTPGALGLRELARPWMNAVHGRVRQHTQLGILSGLDVLFIERLSTRDAVVNATLIGGRIPLPLSSSGLVLLAHAGDGVLQRVLDAGWPRLTSQSIADADELRERLRVVRAEGFCVASGHIYNVSRGIAVPVFGPFGEVYAAISVIVPNDDAPVQPLVELLAIAAAGIRRALDEAYRPERARQQREAEPSAPLISPSRATLKYFASLGVDASELFHNQGQPFGSAGGPVASRGSSGRRASIDAESYGGSVRSSAPAHQGL